MEPVYTPVVGAAAAFFKIMGWDIRVRGSDHIPREGPVVIATNHVGYLDFAFVGYGAREQGRLVRFMAKKEIFDHPVAGPLMRGMKHISVDRFGRPDAAVRAAGHALEEGQVVGMFPESTISRSFVPAAGKTGAARMAMNAGALLVPGAVWGSQRILTKGRPRNFQRKVAVSVDFAAPIPYEPDDDAGEVTKRLMARIGELVEQAAADYPQQPAGEDDRWWLPAHLGGTAPSVAEAEEIAVKERIERRARRQAERAEERKPDAE
ncbi:MAG TPA: lysophospholipid acyltransferase family protein [Egibacteraceae bacterium]|nr:lysophospholipid acyltransferase family protein [Egibacteraceae bacterium]